MKTKEAPPCRVCIISESAIRPCVELVHLAKPSDIFRTRISLHRLQLPVQTVDATPSNQLIRQYFPKRIILCGKTQSEPKQGSVLFESTLANEIGFVDS
jgi:hypothetical protein